MARLKDLFIGCFDIDAKAGLEHRNYPYDLKRLKFTTLDMIPSLIPSVPIGDNRTKSILILFAYTNLDFIYIINAYIASSRIYRIKRARLIPSLTELL